MKTFAIALSALSLVAGVAQADTFRQEIDNQRQHGHAVSVHAEQTVRVPASSILSNNDLTNAPFPADDLVTVTVFRSTGVIDTGK
ncbi:hypothetical protein JHW45_03780 [Paracoccus stylophorae]|uniref:Uncharacterized protein n=1 Tax=Paracoccus stylophorae TaxID=659350 RepID=A0ABY7SWV7_9RHOB|nr:hypothetical protein [Paracoccus stylophorae]WCR11520.1 hypothetical protein JHW45_03780 [Paracoccus stylophorae]